MDDIIIIRAVHTTLTCQDYINAVEPASLCPPYYSDMPVDICVGPTLFKCRRQGIVSDHVEKDFTLPGNCHASCPTNRGGCGFNPYNAELFFFQPWRLKSFFQFEIIINILVSLFWFFWFFFFFLFMLWAYDNSKYFSFFSVETAFIRQNLPSTDGRFWCIKVQRVPQLHFSKSVQNFFLNFDDNFFKIRSYVFY